jgi:adenylosuccinate synthase
MPATILVGAQWGDEGKGRVADWIAAQSDVVARYAGGDNAGHTVAVGDKVFKLHLIPSGILHARALCVLGNGLVVQPVNFVREIDELIAGGVEISPERLALSVRAHIITPAHIALDKAAEAARGAGAIGTTLRGIGPAYMDKTGRTGLRAGQMRDIDAFAEALARHIEGANARLGQMDFEPVPVRAAVDEYVTAALRLQPFLADVSLLLNERLQAGARVLCEGAQGTLLDVDHGDYPYVTSSSPTVGGALTGLGIGPMTVDRVVGVAKTYSTRVGGGPMPTELFGELAARLRGSGEHFWDEYGTTTGRPRRCGWLDAVQLRYAARVNGFSELVLTKLDVLTGMDELQVAVAYDIDGQRQTTPPSTMRELERARPVYETFAGWRDDVQAARVPEELPAAARAYIDAIASLVGVPVTAVSVGPEREQLVVFQAAR